MNAGGGAAQVAWMNGLMDLAMPYMIQTLRDYAGKVDALVSARKEAQEAAVSEEASKRQQEAQSNAYLSLMPLALPAPPLPGGGGGGGGGNGQFGAQSFGASSGGFGASAF